MSELRVVVADDEKMARRRLLRLLDTLGGVRVVAECKSGEEALRHLDPAQIDVALLDIDMPGLDGLETAKLAEARGVPVIFITAHEQHAVEAFARGAVHFLLKPVELGRLDEALGRVRGGPSDGPSAPLAGRVALTVRGDVVLVPVETITHALYDGELVTVHTTDGAYITAESLQELERRVGDTRLTRVHRRALLNLAHTERLKAQPSGGYLAVVVGGAEVPVSRQAARDLRKRLGL